MAKNFVKNAWANKKTGKKPPPIDSDENQNAVPNLYSENSLSVQLSSYISEYLIGLNYKEDVIYGSLRLAFTSLACIIGIAAAFSSLSPLVNSWIRYLVGVRIFVEASLDASSSQLKLTFRSRKKIDSVVGYIGEFFHSDGFLCEEEMQEDLQYLLQKQDAATEDSTEMKRIHKKKEN
ncbi:hypothetical protein IE077_001378 [Cardiosporidium cionae]|uniref:Uncharacterized protein n=1 Tax=Cardiosporidium cionae TaxID=476202 RepID=A0ABQ7JDG4_9APIC|nr:hypothetical protein IE077_001378 [Cardiosporidium cionae]|eukprot:KAF8821909.1 hypothetical protein IE077_001378 [Cardiosporidium cionae]